MLIAVLALIWTVHVAAVVVIPVISAVLAALTLAPLSNHVRARLPEKWQWLGPLSAVGLLVLVLLLLFAALSLAGRQVISAAPSIIDQAKTLAESSSALLNANPLVSPEQAQGLIGRLAEPMLAFVQNAMSMALGTLANLVLIIFLALFMLLEAPSWRRKFAALDLDPRWLGALEEASGQLRRFLLARLFLGALTGALYASWLFLFGVDLLLTWAMLALVLNFIPTIGSIIAGTLPVLYVLVTRDPAAALLIGSGLLVIEQIMGNYVDPKVMGKQLSLSALVVLVALIFWSWVWGPVGALLATPVTVLILDLCRPVPALRPLAVLLGSGDDERGKSS